jgi:prostaglandin-H2 D-isomerase / glutathione transferase
MSKPKLTYFDGAFSRGEECRLALHVAGVDFEDRRLTRPEWLDLKPETPFGSLPLLEMPGHPVLAQSNAILVLIGRLHGLHPKDNFEAARHEAIMQYVEDLRGHVAPTMRISDPEAKKAAREHLANALIPTWGANVEKQIGDGPFFGGEVLQVVDLKLLMIVQWFESGALDDIPMMVLRPFPKLNRLYAAVTEHAGVKAWRARKP